MTKDNIEIENKINDFSRRIKQLENLKISKDFLIGQGFTYNSLDTVLVKRNKQTPNVLWWCEVTPQGWVVECQGFKGDCSVGDSNVYEFKTFADLKRFFSY